MLSLLLFLSLTSIHTPPTSTDGARCSIDSTNMLEFRASDLDSSSLTEQEAEPSPIATTESFFTTATSSGFGTAATAVTTASGATEIVVTPISLQQHHHHPHMLHHHRQYRQHLHHHYHFSPSATQGVSQSVTQPQQRVIPRVTVVEAGRATRYLKQF